MSDQTTVDRLARANRLAKRLRHEAQGSQYPFHGLLTEAAEKIEELTALLAEAERPTVDYESATYEAIGRYAVASARWIRHEHEHYAAVPVAFGANLESQGMRFAALSKAAALAERPTPPPDAVTRAKLEERLSWVRKFIEYARYELQPGTQQPGDQFPRQDAADRAITEIDACLDALRAHLKGTPHAD